MQPLHICIGPTIHIGRESWCLPYAGFSKYRIGEIPYLEFVCEGQICLWFIF